MYVMEETEPTQTARPIFGLPVDTSILFSDKTGVHNPRIEQKKTRLLQKLGFLGKFLDADETIVLVTTGCAPFTALEQMTIGAAWLADTRDGMA